MDQHTTHTPTIDEEDRREFLKLLGLAGGIGAAGELTLGELRSELGEVEAAELAAMGQAIRNDLTGSLDAEVLTTALEGTVAAAETLPELRAAGYPGEDATAYQELTDPAWAAYEHLVEVGFFASAEEHLPAYNPEYLASTTRELIRTEPLIAALRELGFGEREVTAMVAEVANEQDRLLHWVPTGMLPTDSSAFDVENVSPLHQRAAGGALLWIDGLDDHLWRNQVLVTEEMYDRGVWDVRTMLGGFHLLATVAHDIAAVGDLSDSQIAAGLAGGAAVMIVGQENLAGDLFRITDEMRAPRGGD